MRILGVDPGLNTTGYGLLDADDERLRLLEAGVVRGTPRGTLAQRIREMYEGLRDVIETFQPSTMALERLYSHYNRPTTAILMGHARGAIVLAASLADIPITDYAATQVKKTLTGSGRAPKTQMQAAVQRELGLTRLPEPPDVADALALAVCHWYAMRLLPR